MICPICKAKMNVTQTIDSTVSPLTIREYRCPKNHTWIGQEELLDEVEEFREAISKKLQH